MWFRHSFNRSWDLHHFLACLLAIALPSTPVPAALATCRRSRGVLKSHKPDICNSDWSHKTSMMREQQNASACCAGGGTTFCIAIHPSFSWCIFAVSWICFWHHALCVTIIRCCLLQQWFSVFLAFRLFLMDWFVFSVCFQISFPFVHSVSQMLSFASRIWKNNEHFCLQNKCLDVFFC